MILTRALTDYDHVLVNNTALVKVDAQFQSAEISYGSVKIAEGVGE